MVKYIRLNQQFDAERLQREVAQLETAFWQDHYNRRNYEGSWSSPSAASCTTTWRYTPGG
jgi:hypothetical protein